MIPNNALSAIPHPAPFLSPDDLYPDPGYSWQLGGIGLSDPSQGMQVQNWYLEIQNGTDAVISSPTQLPLILFSLISIESVSLAFDQNMKPCVGYVSQGNAGFWWFDTTVPGYTFLALPTGASAPQITLDDKRALSITLGKSDVIVTYIRNNNLFFLMERDRYTIEYLLLVNVSSYLTLYARFVNKVGMASNNRLQWMISGSFYG